MFALAGGVAIVVIVALAVLVVLGGGGGAGVLGICRGLNRLQILGGPPSRAKQTAGALSHPLEYPNNIRDNKHRKIALGSACRALVAAEPLFS